MHFFAIMQGCVAVKLVGNLSTIDNEILKEKKMTSIQKNIIQAIANFGITSTTMARILTLMDSGTLKKFDCCLLLPPPAVPTKIHYKIEVFLVDDWKTRSLCLKRMLYGLYQACRIATLLTRNRAKKSDKSSHSVLQ